MWRYKCCVCGAGCETGAPIADRRSGILYALQQGAIGDHAAGWQPAPQSNITTGEGAAPQGVALLAGAGGLRLLRRLALLNYAAIDCLAGAGNRLEVQLVLVDLTQHKGVICIETLGGEAGLLDIAAAQLC